VTEPGWGGAEGVVVGVRWPSDRVLETKRERAGSRLGGDGGGEGPVTRPSRVCMREGGGSGRWVGGGGGPVTRPSRIWMREGGSGGGPDEAVGCARGRRWWLGG
jgi:hypothetical protein